MSEDSDATAVRRLAEATAIVVGKTNVARRNRDGTVGDSRIRRTPS
jgi:Asp-tRNA(Asn)/Glu-tRNA(Gln) amidotransferase A subunit family amidase